MEAFTLLNYWRGAGAGAAPANVRSSAPTVTTIADAVSRPEMDTEDEEDDDGPFFDMEFTVPDEGDGDGEDEDEDDEEGSSDEDRGFGFTVSSGGSEGRSDLNLTASPSDGLFYNGKLLPLEAAADPRPPQFPVSLLKTATKFRIFLLGFKKPKPPVEAVSPQKRQEQPSRFFAVKLKVEEVPIVSLFTRDNSTRSSAGKPQKQAAGDSASTDGGISASDARRFAKVVMHKYLKMIKPLYVKVSRRHGDKLRFSGQLSQAGKAAAAPAAKLEVEPCAGAAAAAAAPANGKNQKQGNLPAGLRVVSRHLGKSRSASAAVAAAPWQSQRRDDSLLQQQDGIQSAIAHCKRSFNASKETEISLARCSSDPSADGSLRNSMHLRL